MSYKYNPLLVGKLDRVGAGASRLGELDDVNTAGTVGGYVLTYGTTLDTWTPKAAAGGGDMLKSVYDTDDDGVVDNSERLEGETLATVQAHTVDAINILGTLTDANIPDVETLSYAVPFADAQIPTLDATKILTGTFDAAQIPDLPTSRVATGTFVADRIPTMENLNGTVPDGKIPNVESLSYGGAFATAQIPSVGAYKIASGTLAVARHETLDNLNGTVALSQVPTMDDAHIPDLETLSYGGTFAAAQIPDLPTTKITSGTFDIVRIPSITNAYLAGEITSDKISALSGTAISYPLNADTVGTTAIKASGVGNVELAASGLDISKFTIGTAGLARIPSLPTSRITTGTFVLARIPTIDDARIPDVETLSYGAAFATAQIPSLAASKITSGSFNVNRIPILPTNRYGSAVLLTGAQSIGGTKTFSDIPILPASDPSADNEAARKAYVDSAAGGATEGTYSSSFSFGSAQAIQDAGTAFTIGGFMTHGYIKELKFRANYTAGTFSTVTGKVNNASGIYAAGTVIANDGRSGTFSIGDYIESENEIMRISGTVSPGTLIVSRAKKGSGAAFIDDNEDIVRLNSGFTLQLFKNTNKKKYEMPLMLSSLMTAKGVTDASISSGNNGLELSADLKNVDNLDTIRLIDGANSEDALVQQNTGDTVSGPYDFVLYTYDSLGSHPSGIAIEKYCKYDIPSNYKSSAGTLYGRVHLMESHLGSNLSINIDIKGDKF